VAVYRLVEAVKADSSAFPALIGELSLLIVESLRGVRVRLKRSALGVVLLIVMTACGSGVGARPDRATSSTTSPATTAASLAPSASSSSTGSPRATPRPTSTSADRLELPRGGRQIFPRYRLVGYAGLTGASSLGRLGTGPLDQRVAELDRRGRSYRAGRDVLPVLEVISTIVQAAPGRDGKYRIRIDDEQIKVYLGAARRRQALLLLNIQPGRSEFLPEIKAYRKWLEQPDVGIALDPEWAMDAHQVPGRAYGHTTGAELDGVAAYLSDLVQTHQLPEKVLVYHQVARSVVRRESALRRHRGVVVIKSVDGLGPPGPKIATYRMVNQTTPSFVHAGFKLFFTEDRRNGRRLMTPREVLALHPRPDYIMYE
jgi:hypothetical protein